MLKTVFFLVKLSLLASVVGWFVLNPGTVTIEWFDIDYEVHVGIAILAVLILSAFGMIILHTFLAIKRLPQLWKSFFEKRQEKKGYQSFTEALGALAMEDLETTRDKILKTEIFLGESPLPLILTALAAQKANDCASATRAYGLLLKNKATEFLGYYGLSQTAQKQQDYQASYLYTKKAIEISKSSKWGILTLFQLSLRLKDYSGAFALMKKIKKYNLVNVQKYKHFEALIFYLQSIQETDPKTVIKKLQKAFNAEPFFIPAVLALGNSYLDAEKPTKAEKILQESLKISPHPDVAELYIKMYKGNSSGGKIARAEEILKYSRTNRMVGHAILTRIALEEGFTGIARTHLDLAIIENKGLSPNLYFLGQQLEVLTDADSQFSSKQHLHQIFSKKADYGWVCTACHISQHEWSFLCQGCDQMDTIIWKELHSIHTPSKELTI